MFISVHERGEYARHFSLISVYSKYFPSFCEKIFVNIQILFYSSETCMVFFDGNTIFTVFKVNSSRQTSL